MDRAKESSPSRQSRGRSSHKVGLSPLSRPESGLSLDTSSALEQSSSAQPSEPSTPSNAGFPGSGIKSSGAFHSTRSILNLTSSTLLGIYKPAGIDVGKDEATPSGPGSQTPLRREFEESLKSLLQSQKEHDRFKDHNDEPVRNRAGQSSQRPRSTTGKEATSLAIRVILLFGLGLAYGRLITQIHDKSAIPAVRLEGIDQQSWAYLISWGVTASALGSLLPFIDELKAVKKQDSEKHPSIDAKNDRRGSDRRRGESNRQVTLSLGADWNPMVRSIGAFVGIAFAIRRLPWQSTFQVSLTLALANPVIWYIIDRTRAGFILSTLVGVIGSAVLLVINPTWVPSPAGRVDLPFSTQAKTPANTGNLTALNAYALQTDDLFAGLVSYKSIGAAAWIASVLFCSSVFFGNVGRRLLLLNRPVSRALGSSG